MTIGPENEVRENLLVFSGGGDTQEKQEMAMVLRELADAIEQDRNVGCPLLVLEEECLKRLKAAHRRVQSAAQGS
jgi:uncharacterized protein YutD